MKLSDAFCFHLIHIVHSRPRVTIYQSNFDKTFLNFFQTLDPLTLAEKFAAYLLTPKNFCWNFYMYLSSIVCLVNKDVCNNVEWKDSIRCDSYCFSFLFFFIRDIVIVSNEWQISKPEHITVKNFDDKRKQKRNLSDWIS